MRARIRDTELFFDIDGLGLVPDGSQMRQKPPAFLVHGGPGVDHSGSKAGFAPLSQRLQLIHFDHRGHGRSARGSKERYTINDNVEDMEALRQYLGLGPIVSIGTSYGGMVAMAHAARYPDAVSHLILVVTAAHSGFIDCARKNASQRGTAEQIEQCEALFSGRIDTREKMRRYFEVMGALYSVRHDPVQAKSRLDRMILEPEPLNAALAPSGVLRNFDLRPELHRITAPTLIIAGRHDWICPPEFSEEIHGLVKGSDFRIFEESSHLILADETQNFLDAVAGFLVYSVMR